MTDDYYQITGRPNEGLKDPAKYGLTFSEVVALIENGQWNNFRNKWNKQQQKIQRIKEHNYQCPICYQKVIDLDKWNLQGRRCKQCSYTKKKKIKLPGQKLDRKNVPKKRCHFCNRLSAKTKIFMKRLICGPCYVEFRELANEVQR